jgi:hypothetical protein
MRKRNFDSTDFKLKTSTTLEGIAKTELKNYINAGKTKISYIPVRADFGGTFHVGTLFIQRSAISGTPRQQTTNTTIKWLDGALKIHTNTKDYKYIAGAVSYSSTGWMYYAIVITY